MAKRDSHLLAVLLMTIVFLPPACAATDIEKGWLVQSSAKVSEKGDTISTAAFRLTGWYPADMPSTVMAALVANKVYADRYYGMTSLNRARTRSPMEP